MTLDLSPIWISIKVSFLATAVVFVVGTAAAWAMTRYRGRWKGLLDGLLTLPLVLPPTVVGFGLLLLLGVNGPVGRVTKLFDVQLIFTWYAAVIAAAVVSFPMMYRTTRGAFEQLDDQVLDAARTLGARESRVFFKVALPLAWPGIAAATALTFARALGEFGATLMVAGSIPGQTQTLPIAIYFATQGGDTQAALFWVLLIFALSLSVMGLMTYFEALNKRRESSKGGR